MYLVVPLVDLALGVNTEDGRVCCVDESLQLLLDSIVLISIQSNDWTKKCVQTGSPKKIDLLTQRRNLLSRE